MLNYVKFKKKWRRSRVCKFTAACNWCYSQFCDFTAAYHRTRSKWTPTNKTKLHKKAQGTSTTKLNFFFWCFAPAVHRKSSTYKTSLSSFKALNRKYCWSNESHMFSTSITAYLKAWYRKGKKSKHQPASTTRRCVCARTCERSCTHIVNWHLQGHRTTMYTAMRYGAGRLGIKWGTEQMKYDTIKPNQPQRGYDETLDTSPTATWTKTRENKPGPQVPWSLKYRYRELVTLRKPAPCIDTFVSVFFVCRRQSETKQQKVCWQIGTTTLTQC